MCAVHAGDNANEMTLPEQGDKIFDSSDYNVSVSYTHLTLPTKLEV